MTSATATSAVAPHRTERVLALGEAAARRRRLAGGKAASLADLISAGLPVPEGFVIPAGAEDFGPEMLKRFRSLGPGARVAVRSSGRDEDTVAASRAGRHLTRLGILTERDLLEAVAACRASGERARMAVLVQRMVDASASGVLFTADPVTGDPSRILVAARAGTGGVVEGENAAEAVLDAEGGVIEADSIRALVSRRLLKHLVHLAMKIERRRGMAQDIEWAIERDRVFILQARPLTALPPHLPAPEVSCEHRLAFPGRFSIFGRTLEMARQRVYDRAVRRWTGRDADTRLLDVAGFLYESVERRRSPVREALAAVRSLLPGGAALRAFRQRVVPSHLARLRSGEDRAAAARTIPECASALSDLIAEAFAFQARSLEVALAVERFPLIFLGAARILAPNWDAEAALSGAAEITKHRDRLLAQAAEPALLKEVGYLLVPGNPRDPGRAELSEPDLSTAPNVARDATAVAPTALPGPAPIRWLLGRLLALARLHLPFREEKNHLFDRGAWAVRHGLKALGAMLETEGIFESTSDAAQLTVGEATELPEDWRAHFRDIATDLPDRRARERSGVRMRPPARLLPRDARAERPSAQPDVSGAAGAPGTAEGPARVVRGPEDFDRVRPGDIVVTPRLRPFMSSLLVRAAGLVAEEGTALSHAATLAREYGVPAVVGAAGSTESLADGERVRILGSEGRVIRVRA